jgi:hypothetical protein
VNKINLYVNWARLFFSDCADSQSEPFGELIVTMLGVGSFADYDFILDSFYLFEDTQTAKENFQEFGVGGPTKYKNIGEHYLRLYGILNACFLQKEAITVCSRKLLNSDLPCDITNAQIIEFRNIFAAHTVTKNGKTKDSRHSYILDRHALTEGRLSGISSNIQDDYGTKDAVITELLKEWDVLLERELQRICRHIIDQAHRNRVFDIDIDHFKTVLDRIDQSGDRIFVPDIWAKDARCIVHDVSAGVRL